MCRSRSLHAKRRDEPPQRLPLPKGESLFHNHQVRCTPDQIHKRCSAAASAYRPTNGKSLSLEYAFDHRDVGRQSQTAPYHGRPVQRQNHAKTTKHWNDNVRGNSLPERRSREGRPSSFEASMNRTSTGTCLQCPSLDPTHLHSSRYHWHNIRVVLPPSDLLPLSPK